MFELEPTELALRDALGQYRHDRDEHALLPSLFAYGRAARHQGRSLEDACTNFRALFDGAHMGTRAGVRQRQRCERLVRTLATGYTKPTSGVTIGRTAGELGLA